jgi:hypothetical protein
LIRTFSALLAIAGCSGAAPAPASPPERAPEPATPIEQLRRELEAAALESLGQLTLGNLEAYADGMRLDKPVVLFGARASDNFVATAEGTSRVDRRPLADLYPQLLSKNLDVVVAPSGAVGWIFDEISLRVPVDGRWASIPIRVTSIYTRDVDRWVLAVDHWSYARPVAEIAAAAVAPDRLAGQRDAPGRVADTLIAMVGRLENGDRRVRELRRSRESGAVLLLPGLEGEYHGAAIAAAPTLVELFGGASGEGTVGIRSHRIEAGPAGETAWIAANLVVDLGREKKRILLRATYVLAHGAAGWQVVQEHVSAPVEDKHFDQMLFGDGEPVAAQAASAPVLPGSSKSRM